MHQYIAMCKYILKVLQIIITFDEVLIHVLNISWLKHFNSIWKVPFMWFHKKHLDKVFHSNKHNYVEKKIVEKLLLIKRCWGLLYQIPLYMFIKMLDEINKKLFSK
jgi:hypothetical protein